MPVSSTIQWTLASLLVISSLGVVLARKPVHASLAFLFSLFMLASLYLQLSAQFISVMQVLIYAGAILVIFMFVIVLFQDAYEQIERFKPKSAWPFLAIAGTAFLLTFIFFGRTLSGLPFKENLPHDFGTVQSLGYALYIDYFFPFEAVILIFLVALVGTLYIGRKEK